jgi:hypothetical protein
MPRALKVFQTHIGFYDLIVAAPSMKAAAEAWGAHTRLFAQGFAAETKDPTAVRAALAEPGIVLRRPHGQAGVYKRDPETPVAPKLTPRQKKAVASAKEAQRHKKAQEKKRQAETEREARRTAEAELAAIEREEAKLRERRQSLQKRFRLRAIDD